jgi:hypothetical protein
LSIKAANQFDIFVVSLDAVLQSRIDFKIYKMKIIYEKEIKNEKLLNIKKNILRRCPQP